METIITIIIALIAITFISYCMVNDSCKKEEAKEITEGSIWETDLFPSNPYALTEKIEILDIKEDWIKYKSVNCNEEKSMRISYLKANYTPQKEK